MRLAAGLCGPLWELTVLPQTSSWMGMGGDWIKGRKGGEKRGKREDGRVGEGKRKGRGGRTPRKNQWPPTLAPWSCHWCCLM